MPAAKNSSRTKGRVTMREVATLAGVGLKTVSRVINDEPNVSAETAERVRVAAEKLRYQPDLYAGNLRRRDRSTGTLGLLLADATDPFEAVLQRAIEAEIERRKMVMITMSLDENETRQRRSVKELLRRRVDGLIMMPVARNESYLLEEQENGLPLVFVDRSATGVEADTVLTNNAQAAASAAEQLMDLGHRHIALVGRREEIATERDREIGFLDAIRSRGDARIQVTMEIGLEGEGPTVAAIERLFQRTDPPTAVFTAQNMLTIGAVRALHRLDLQNEIALIGFDDFALSDLLEPGVTVLQQDPAAMGKLAAERLLARIDGDRSAPRLDIVPSRLVQRGSGEIRPRAS